MATRNQVFYEELVKAVLAGGFGNRPIAIPSVYGGQQRGKSYVRSVAEILKRALWHNQPQPPRTYTGHVARLDGASDKEICQHPSNILRGAKVIGRWFIARREGGEYEFVSKTEWERLRPLVPIYGERAGDRMMIFDRIIAEGGGGSGYREKSLSEQALLDAGYRHEGDMLVWYDEATSITEGMWKNMHIAIDVGSIDGTSWPKWHYKNGKLVVDDWGRSFPSTDPEPAQKMLADPVHAEYPEVLKPHVEKPAKPVDFFPNKIDRIAKMPRYPGVWG